MPASAPPGSTKPFTLITDDAGVNAALAQALFKPSAASLDAKAAPATLTLEFRDASGLSARKEFSFSPQKPYEVTLSTDVSRGGTALVPTIAWGPALATGRVSSGMTYSPSSQPLYYLNGKVTRVKFPDVAAHAQVEGNIGFGGVDDHYFLAAVVAPGAAGAPELRTGSRRRSRVQTPACTSCRGRCGRRMPAERCGSLPDRKTSTC